MVAPSLPLLPHELAEMRTLALDLRWTWSHEGDAFWSSVDADLWERTHNPWLMLQSVTGERLSALASDVAFGSELKSFATARQQYLLTPGWFRGRQPAAQLNGIAYFSMEFGLGEALPLYAGGLGVLAGDYLKTASDLDLPVTGVGLLYQEGYFRQTVDAAGVQHEFYPYNEPAAMPIEPVITADGTWLRVAVDLPGRHLQLRVWQATIGRATLYLLDSNFELNSPPDRGITARLYEDGAELRLLQEIVLGIGGWTVVEALRPDVEVCHINEGHSAFAILERARQLAIKADIAFPDALWTTRAGNVFTTHTPVSASVDRFPPELIRKYLAHLETAPGMAGVSIDDILAMGRADPMDTLEPFNTTYLAHRGSALCFGVSRLHGEVSRRMFQPIFPRWPEAGVPVDHITNGVHIPTWDSPGADRIWTQGCGKERWRSTPGKTPGLDSISDEALWAMRGEGRRHVVEVARARLSMQLRQRGVDEESLDRADLVLDPNLLVIGLARRFTEYKRPNLMLRDLRRLERLLLDDTRPIQIIVAGKAHAADFPGKAMIQQWLALAQHPRFRERVVFLEDYDIALAQDLVQGVDLWINTPRRLCEASGTSGMKILVNGGLNCSTLDGWWDEAFEPDVGWAIGTSTEAPDAALDEEDANALFTVLEQQIVPEFYDRDGEGLPRAWLRRIRSSMTRLTPAFGSARMMQEYLDRAYLPLAVALRARARDDYALARELGEWSHSLRRHWPGVHIGSAVYTGNEGRDLAIPIVLGDVSPSSVQAGAIAEMTPEFGADLIPLRLDHPIPGTTNGYIYTGVLPASRPVDDYTVRVVAHHESAFLPAELPLIAWPR